MGTWYTSYTIIGYRVKPNKKKVEEKTTTSNCEHNPPSDAKFCPTCGVKVGKVVNRCMTDAWEEFYAFSTEEKLPANMRIEHAEADDYIFWVGYGNSSDREDERGQRIDIKPYDEIKAEIAALVKPWTDAGLFELDENTFGIWTVVIGS